eukprot:scaffold420_cov404-Prasinococcus_capsulatus_cf.AAC.19
MQPRSVDRKDIPWTPLGQILGATGCRRPEDSLGRRQVPVDLAEGVGRSSRAGRTWGLRDHSASAHICMGPQPRSSGTSRSAPAHLLAAAHTPTRMPRAARRDASAWIGDGTKGELRSAGPLGVQERVTSPRS